MKKERNPRGIRESLFPASLFAIYLGVLFLMSGIHTGLIVFINRSELPDLVQVLIPMVYWGMVAVGLTLFTRSKIRSTYEEPLHKMAEATSRVAGGDFSVYVPTVHTQDRWDYLDVMIVDFNKMVEELGSIETLKTDFVSNVSHELRTPLTSVHSYVEALSDGAWKDKDIAPQFLTVIQNETNRMIRMINDLLSLSRMDSGTTKLNLEYVNIKELFNYILNRFDMIIKKDENDQNSKKYTIERYFTDKDLWVEIDTDKFTQVIDNIMNNAIKYSPDGGVITTRLLETHNHVILSISDQGLGIPRKDLGRIFDRFFRVDKARSRKQGGTGLGLAISKEVINLLGGQIWVDSIEGQGSTFYISLPYVPYEEEDDWDD